MNPHQTLLAELHIERAQVKSELEAIERERAKLRQQDKALLLRQVDAEGKLHALRELRKRANVLRSFDAPRRKRSKLVRVWRLLWG